MIFAPPCLTCRHSITAYGKMNCNHPQLVEAGKPLDDGTKVTFMPRAVDARAASGCGRDGKLWAALDA